MNPSRHRHCIVPYSYTACLLNTGTESNLTDHSENYDQGFIPVFPGGLRIPLLRALSRSYREVATLKRDRAM